MGAPLRALAMARRQHGASQGPAVTFVRLDLEMGNLGPVSLRMSGGDGNPLRLRLFVPGSSMSAIEDALPDLETDLAQFTNNAHITVHASEDPLHDG